MLKLIDMMHIAIFPALMAVLGFMPPLFLSFTPVPITLQTLGVMLAGSILRPKSAFLSQLVFLLFAKAAGFLASRRLRSAAVARRTRRFWCVFRTERRLFDCLSPRFMADQFSR